MIIIIIIYKITQYSRNARLSAVPLFVGALPIIVGKRSRRVLLCTIFKFSDKLWAFLNNVIFHIIYSYNKLVFKKICILCRRKLTSYHFSYHTQRELFCLAISLVNSLWCSTQNWNYTPPQLMLSARRACW